jgi:hypothetical protein
MVEIPTVMLLCLFQGLVAGLLRPRPSLKQIGQSSKSVRGTNDKYRETALKIPLLCLFQGLVAGLLLLSKLGKAQNP